MQGATTAEGLIKHPLRPLTVVAFLLLLDADPASAQQGRPPVELTVLEVVNLPEERPRLTVTARDVVAELRIAISERGATVASKRFDRLAPGDQERVTWTAEPGLHEYIIDVSGRTDQGQTSLSSQMKVSVLRPVEIFLRKEEVDLEARCIRFSINNPASHAELTIYNPQGRAVHQADIEFGTSPPASGLKVNWPMLGESVGRIELRVFDTSDSWAGIELLPFAIEIPHAEVTFDTASWEIGLSERPKLDAAYELIISAIRDHGSDLKARLYVVGHTDTVGSEADNMVLSKNRAVAISRYLLAKGGIILPIEACGLGETSLAIKTGDNVNEPRNRRAQYILAAQEPVAAQWTTLSTGGKRPR